MNLIDLIEVSNNLPKIKTSTSTSNHLTNTSYCYSSNNSSSTTSSTNSSLNLIGYMNNSNNTPSQQQPQQQGPQLHQLPLDKEDKYYSIIEEENKTKLKLILEQEKDRLKALMPNIYMPSSTSTSSSSSSSSASNNTNTNGTSNKSEAYAELANVAGKQQHQFVSSSVPLPPQPIALNSTSINNYHLNDANKAFDDVVFDILKVDPDYIAVGFESFCLVFRLFLF